MDNHERAVFESIAGRLHYIRDGPPQISKNQEVSGGEQSRKSFLIPFDGRRKPCGAQAHVKLAK